MLQPGTQTLTATFTPADTKNYSSATASVTINATASVSQPSTLTGPVITWPQPAAVPAGTPLGAAQLDATANIPGTFTYNPAAGTVLQAGTQTLRAHFNPNDTGTYSAVDASTTISVLSSATQAPTLTVPVITWSTPAAVPAGTVLSAGQLDATANVPGTFAYSPAAGTVLQAGTLALTVDFTPTDSKDYSSTTASTMITVTSATPIITWAQPASVIVGTALSSTQLNATANVPGTFAYNPAAGTVLQAGTQTLTATFTPTDSKNYSSATASTAIDVTSKTTPVITWLQPASVTAGTALSSTQLNATANVPGTFAYNPAAGTVLQAGTQTLTATFTPTDSKDYSSATASTAIDVTLKTTPVITWLQPASVTAGTALSSAQLNATANVPGTFAYNPTAGTVLQAGTQTLTAMFTPTDSKDYSSTTASTTITVTSATPVITWPQPASVTAGIALSSAQLNATANVPGTFAYNPAAGTVLHAGAQTLTVNFTPNDSKDYSSATASTTITITSATPVITWPQPAGFIAGNALSSTELNATANVPGTFIYSPAAGTVLQAGTQTLTATFTPTDSKDYSSATASTTITVTSTTTPLITWPKPASVTAGTALSSTQLNATANVPGAFTYNPAAGTVLQAGTQTLTATFTPNDSKDYSSATASTTITVTSTTTPVITWPQPASVIAGTALSSAQLNATANVPGTFTYSPAAGTVLHPGAQTLTVNFTPGDSNSYSSASASTSITVTSATPVVIWPQPASITAGTALSSIQLNATANVAGTFAYTPVAGTVLQAGTQTLTATFTPNDSKDYSSTAASTTITVTSATPVITWSQPASVTAGTALSSTQLNATANVLGTFVYNPAAGTVLQAGTQTLTATFTPNDSKDYSSTAASTTITVTSATPVITWPQPASVTAGTALSSTQLNATANVLGTFAYNPAAGTVLQAGTQTLTATFTPNDPKDYSSATASTTVTVTSATPVITWPQPASVTAGTALSSTQLNATANVPGTFTYNPAAGTLVQAGTQKLTATFTPTDSKDYSSATASTTITVTATTTPVITWPQLASVTAGTALSSAQLNATANVAGTFTYNPAAGTVLHAGSQTLTATFTPSDSKNYSSATASISITVTLTNPVITWPQPASVIAGTALSSAQLDATANVAGTFTYNPAAGALLQAGTQTLTAAFTPTDSKDYSSATASTTITVTSATPVITWPQPASVIAGTALSSTQLNATANVAGTFTYSPAAGTVLHAGAQTLTVNFTPTDSKDYSSTTASTTITVTSTTPVVTWPQPVSVTAGTALGSTQLNATANVAGTFTYSPAAGTVLQAGTQTLTVSFTPTDSKDYSSTTTSTTISVTSTQTQTNTYNVNSSMSESTIQSTVNTACGSSGNTVAFAAGNYTGWTTTLNIPTGNGCIITGPASTSQPFVGTAILNSDGNIQTTTFIMQFTGPCTSSNPGSAATIEYLTLAKSGGIGLGGGCGGFKITHNEFKENNPAVGSYYNSSIGMGGTGSWANSGWDISWNNFHDNCQLIDAVMDDLGGYCAATFVNGSASNASWNNNTVNNMEQGFKIVTTSGSYISNVTAQGNNINQVHRIQIEWQTANMTTINNNTSYNYFGPPLLPCYFTFANSVPLYNTGSPANTTLWNVVIAGQPVACPTFGGGAHYGIAYEVWGNGLVMQNNLIEGGTSPQTGFSPISLGAGNGANVTNNYECGADAFGVGIDSSAGTPTNNAINPNTVVSTCSTQSVPTPTISPASGSFGTPPTVTMAESQPGSTIYYTTDGSTPSVATSNIYTGPFTAPSGNVTIKAIAQWGIGANQRISFPSGYGYTPSTTVSASYTAISSPAARPAATAANSQANSSATASTAPSWARWPQH